MCGTFENTTVLFGQTPPAVASDRKADVVAQNRAGYRPRDHPPQREPAEVRQCRTRQQRRLAGDRQAGVFEQHTDEHDGVPIPGEEIGQPLRHHTMLTGQAVDIRSRLFKAFLN